MKFKNCYIDKDGNVWKEATLIKAAMNIKPKKFNVSSTIGNTILQWKLITARDYISHYKRVTVCDIKIPIILHPDGTVMDGWHRIIKAKVLGIGIKCKQLTKLPEPDFKP